MGKKNAVTKEYIKDPVRFADAFNKYLYGGRQVIRPEQLWELDAEEIVLPYGDGNAGAAVQRYRDALMLVMTDGSMAYCILGIENQGEIHYAMPVKNMVYDSLQLAGQVTETARTRKARKKAAEAADQTQKHDSPKRYIPNSGEFLSGFYKTDRLLPVVTLVIYFGTDEWDGPLSLREMYAEADESIMKYVPDYRVNLIAPYHMTDEELGEFKTDLREVMTFLKYAKDKKKLGEAVQKDMGFKHMDRLTANVINATTNANLKYSEKEEDVDMCLAIQQMIEDGKEQVRLEEAEKIRAVETRADAEKARADSEKTRADAAETRADAAEARANAAEARANAAEAKCLFLVKKYNIKFE